MALLAAMPGAPASYLPESLLIQIGPDLQLFAENPEDHQPPTPAALGFFFHEYCHYLHNISTLSGLAAWINTIELWRLFRASSSPDGWSEGSSARLDTRQRQHLETLLHYLYAARCTPCPTFTRVAFPESVQIIALAPETVVTSAQGTVLTAIKGDADVRDSSGEVERIRLQLGTLELLEGAAWILEGLLVHAITPHDRLVMPPVFPYRVFEAAAELRVPGLDAREAAACVLTALQSSNAPAEIDAVFLTARQARACGADVVNSLAEMVRRSLVQCKPELDGGLAKLDDEFAGNGVFATTIRFITSVARRGFQRRIIDPFFEFQVIQSVRDGTDAFRSAIRDTAPCAVLQKRAGDADRLGRDSLYSFLPVPKNGEHDDEVGLRVIHAAFDFMKRHCTHTGFRSTKGLPHRPCPFYTCCTLALRQLEPEICKKVPWESTDWLGWGENGACWYGTAVRVTRPPNSR